jgi:sugar/nucleoside kinase (ribokinase family)
MSAPAQFDIVLFGPVAADLVVVGDQTTPTTGGGVWYGAFPLLTLGLRTAVVTRLARADFPVLDGLRQAGAEVFPVPAFQSSGIRNVYRDASMETRTCTMLGSSGPLLPEEIPPVDGKVLYCGALIRGEIPLQTVRFLARRGPVSVDLQGYLRYRSGNDLHTGRYDGLDELLSLSHWVKADLAEMKMATGLDTPEEGAAALASHGPAEVMISGPGYLSVFAEGTFHKSPLDPASMAGRTGRGDTAMCTYLGARLRGADSAKALECAAFVTSRKMENPGPYHGPVPL